MRKLTFILSSISLLISISILSIYVIDMKKDLTVIFQDSLLGVVEIKASTDDIESFGTAVILSDFELVTNFHVVSFTSHSEIYVHNNIKIRFSDSDEYQTVEMKQYDSNLDLALLVMENTQGRILKANLSGISTGQNVLLLGNGNNLGISLTTGLISRNEVEINFNDNTNKYIQIDATSTNGIKPKIIQVLKKIFLMSIFIIENMHTRIN